MPEFKLLYVTCSTKLEAKKIASRALESKLIACANIFPDIESIYNWQGKIEENKEAVLLLKTHISKLEELEKLIEKEHSYDCPCIISFDIETISKGFSSFIRDSIK